MVEQLKAMFEEYNVILEGTLNIIGILGGIFGFFGGIVSFFTRKKVKKQDVKIKELNLKNSQIVNTINNYGLSLQDTEYAANRIFDEKTKNISRVYVGDNEPMEVKQNDIWIGGGMDIDFGDEDARE